MALERDPSTPNPAAAAGAAAAEDSLAEVAPDFLGTLLGATPACIKIISPEGELLYINNAGVCMLDGQSAQAMTGTSVYDLIAPEDREEWMQRHARVCAGERLNWEFEMMSLAGVRRHMETYAAPIRLHDGRLGQLAVTRDITRRAEGESARAHLAAIVESSDDAIVSKTLEGVIQTWNIGAQRIFGWRAEEVVGKSITIIIPPDRHHEEPHILAQVRAGKPIDHFETIRRTKDGRLIDVSVTISPVRNAAGRIIGASKVARDITPQKQAQRELEAAKEIAEAAGRQKDRLLAEARTARDQAENANRMKDEFLANLSHELRTPLNAVLGWAQLLRLSPNPADLTEGVQVIERNARAQMQIIEDLLDMSRIISGKVRLDVQRVDVGKVLEAALETVRPAAQAKGVRLVRVLDPSAGPVSGDPSRLQQIFWNLLSNALKFTPKGGRVQVLLERVNSHLEISIIDTGEGIAPEFLPYVFDRFRQADAGTTREHGGLGLGLSIVKQLVELHGGTVRVKSGGIGKGATFIVSLPLMVLHAGAPGTEAPGEESNPAVDGKGRQHPAVSSESSLSHACMEIEGVRVLVVDDQPDARQLLRRMLEECKAIVTTADSVKKALERLAAENFDVLISDIGLPQQDGYELIKRVRAMENHRRLPAIALTAYARSENRIRALLAGFNQYLVKPVDPAELIAMIGVLAGRSG